jgi:hypothetical protein
VVKEWLGKFFRVQSRLQVLFFVNWNVFNCSQSDQPTLHRKYFQRVRECRKSPRPERNTCMLTAPLVPEASDALIFLCNDIQIPDNGPVLGGVGAQAVGTPSPIPPANSGAHLAHNGFVALLAAALGVTLV